MIYMLLAPGFEEVEALFPLDLLRRADVAVTTVAMGDAARAELWRHWLENGMTATNPDDRKLTVTGAHAIPVVADMTEAAFATRLLWGETPDMVILPGGMPGTTNLDASPIVDLALEATHRGGGYLAAICAAPLVLGRRGYLRGLRATCYPGFESELEGATVGGKVIRDGNVITASGAGVAKEFGLELVSLLVSPERAGEINAAIQSL